MLTIHQTDKRENLNKGQNTQGFSHFKAFLHYKILGMEPRNQGIGRNKENRENGTD